MLGFKSTFQQVNCIYVTRNCPSGNRLELFQLIRNCAIVFEDKDHLILVTLMDQVIMEPARIHYHSFILLFFFVYLLLHFNGDFLKLDGQNFLEIPPYTCFYQFIRLTSFVLLVLFVERIQKILLYMQRKWRVSQ